MNKFEILSEIEKAGLQVTIYNELHSVILYKLENAIEKNNELNASIKAIKKINNGKNPAVDALCK